MATTGMTKLKREKVKDWGHKHGYNWDDQIEEGEGEIKEWGREHEDQMPPVEEEGKHGHHHKKHGKHGKHHHGHKGHEGRKHHGGHCRKHNRRHGEHSHEEWNEDNRRYQDWADDDYDQSGEVFMCALFTVAVLSCCCSCVMCCFKRYH